MANSRMDRIVRWVVRYWVKRRRKRRAVNRRAGEVLMVRLDQASDQLALPDRTLPHTRAALYATRATLETFPFELLPIFVVLFVIPMRSLGGMQQALSASAEWSGREHFDALKHFLQSYANAFENFLATQGQAPMAGLYDWLAVFTLVLPSALAMFVLTPRRLGRGADRRFRLNLEVLKALEACGHAQELPTIRRQRSLRKLDRACRRVEEHVLKAHRMVGTIPLRSTRRAPARQHAALVAGILRQQVACLDTAPEKAFADLGAMLATIGEQYAAGQVSALLDVKAYPDAQPLSTVRQAIGETVRIAVALSAATAAAAVAAAILPKLPVPDQARPWVTFGCAAVAALLTSGWNIFTKVVGFVPGRQ
ncbi:hypothetical protein [Kitasatospora sp. NPDC056531]|uniref:hypothetical protein n=1 Tax=Kitasatospora sp. NPDC056531 TaxID=3345856 RepID=UPI0036C63FEE